MDLSYQVYRATASHPNLSSRRRFTGGLYGFFSTVSKIIRETQATDVVFCEDRKPYVRSAEYPSYKQLRASKRNEETRELYLESMDYVREVLGRIQIVPWGVDGYESDDMIAHCVQTYRCRFHRMYAASNDSDLFQLLWCPTFRIYSKDLEGCMTGDKLLRAQGLTPEQFLLLTAITGTHNDVDGVPRVGPVTAKKAIQEPALLRELMANHGALIERNLGLIRLPHPTFPKNTKLPVQARVDVRELFRALDAYDIDVTNTMIKAFEQLSA